MESMDVCGLKGRDCIERNSIKTYNCSKTCVGIYADVVKMKIIEETEGGREKENILKFQGKDEELQQQLKDLIRMEVVKMKRLNREKERRWTRRSIRCSLQSTEDSKQRM